jgi:hypothetical protein
VADHLAALSIHPATVDAIIAAGDELILEPIEGGWRIKRAGPFYVDVLVMLFNYRIAATPVEFPLVYDRFWCYAGKTPAVLTAALLAAAAWNPNDGSEPAGWNKNGQTGEWRAPAVADA